MVPALIHSIKVAGLVLVGDLSGEASSRVRSRDDVDGVLRDNGVLTFHETIDM